jgi:hypothetical protein
MDVLKESLGCRFDHYPNVKPGGKERTKLIKDYIRLGCLGKTKNICCPDII